MDYFLTIASSDPRRAYAELAAALKAEGLEPVAEKAFGRISHRPAALKARAAEFKARGLDHSWPVTYLEGRPVHGGSFAGVQVWAVRGPVRTVSAGRAWRAGGRDYLYLPAVTGGSGSRSAQTHRMFRNARAALHRHGFCYRDVARTWIYLRDILSWYDEFNTVRNNLYGSDDFLGPRFRQLCPASTGIAGRGPRGHCLMDVLAVRPAAQRLRSSFRQGPAASYGSAFARAVSIGRTILVSGTASIDAQGRSQAKGDAPAQSRQTLLNVKAILAEAGAGLEDIRAAVLYCKSRKACAAFLKASPALPMIALLADVCRPELEVELEAIAVRAGR